MLFSSKTSIKNKILIVGGYGQVGRLIAERLAPLFFGQVIIAGRDLSKAKTTAVEIGHGAEARAVDVYAINSAEVLAGVFLVIICVNQTDTQFVKQCLLHNIHYVDISASYDFLSQVEKLDYLARGNNAIVMLSVGVSPGLTNMLAKRVIERMELVEQINIILELSLGDHHGRAAVEWMLDNLDTVYKIKENGQQKHVRTFRESINIRLPSQSVQHPAYRFNFADQHVIGHKFNVPTVSTWIRFENHVLTLLLAKLSQVGMGQILRHHYWRSAVLWLFMNTHWGSNICGVAVQGKGRAKDGKNTLILGLIGHKEALMTAVITAETVRQIFYKDLKPRVYHSEQVITLDSVVHALKRELPDLIVTL